jgi:hypothetical protein
VSRHFVWGGKTALFPVAKIVRNIYEFQTAEWATKNLVFVYTTLKTIMNFGKAKRN